MQELISICIPTYNGEKYLRECLDSVLLQTYKNIEIVIVDDCSSDTTVAIVEGYIQKDSRIKLYKNEHNFGLVGNWNKALDVAKGEWIKFVFQDDLIEKKCLEILSNAVNGHSIVTCDRNFIFDDSVSEVLKKYYTEDLLTLKKLVKSTDIRFLSNQQVSEFASRNLALNFIGEPTAVLFHKRVIADLGSFNSDFSQICDLEYWLRISTAHGLVYVPQYLVSFRVHANSESAKNVLSIAKFKPRYIDPLLLAHELLFSANFKIYRSVTNGQFVSKLNLYLRAKMFEAKLAFEKDRTLNRDFLSSLLIKYPSLKQFYKSSFISTLVYKLVLLKRKFS